MGADLEGIFEESVQVVMAVVFCVHFQSGLRSLSTCLDLACPSI